MLLYLFVSCKKNINNSNNRINTMMKRLKIKDYIIIVGGDENKYNDNTHILHINCNDHYEGLPEKIIKTYNFIYKNPIFSKYTFLVKMDDDTIINKPINNLDLCDYGGYINNNPNSSRDWHIGKCNNKSVWNNKQYDGIFVPYCLGGYSYILSFRILSYFVNINNYNDEIYEDLFIGKILNRNKIYPKCVYNLSEYIESPEHKFRLFKSQYKFPIIII